jgi:hypothetical protein
MDGRALKGLAMNRFAWARCAALSAALFAGVLSACNVPLDVATSGGRPRPGASSGTKAETTGNGEPVPLSPASPSPSPTATARIAASPTTPTHVASGNPNAVSGLTSGHGAANAHIITIEPAIVTLNLPPAEGATPAGLPASMTLAARVLLTDGKPDDMGVDWSVADVTRLAISPDGVVAVKAGAATGSALVTARSRRTPGLSKQAFVTITADGVLRLAISPAIPAGREGEISTYLHVERFGSAVTGAAATGDAAIRLPSGSGYQITVEREEATDSLAVALGSRGRIVRTAATLDGLNVAPNAVTTAARIRTLISRGREGWTSLSGPVIEISRATTTLAAVADLAGFDGADLKILLGSSPEVAMAEAIARGITPEHFAQARGAVDRALDTDRDPVRSLVRDPQTGNFSLMERPPLVTGVSQEKVKSGDTFEIFGNGFSPVAAFNKVTIGGAAAQDVTVNALGTALTAKVPADASSGPSQVAVGDVSVNLPVQVIRAGGTMTRFAGIGIRSTFGDGEPAVLAGLANPQNMAVAPDGTVYLSDLDNRCIRRVTTDGIIERVRCGVRGQGLALDAKGNLYATQEFAGWVLKLDKDLAATTFAGTGILGYSGDGGPATKASLLNPINIQFDSKGNAFIVDVENYRIRKVDTAGIITTVAGDGTNNVATDGALAASAAIGMPAGLAFDAADNLYFTDLIRNQVRRIGAGGKLETVAGNADRGFQGDGIPAKQAALNQPHGILFDSAGDLLIADSGNCRVRKVGPDGIIQTAFGNGECAPANLEGPALKASFQPRWLAKDPAGGIYIATGLWAIVLKVH